MTKPVGSGALFENQAHRVFMELTGSRYDNMAARLRKKKLPGLQFSKDEFRAFVRNALGGHEDGFVFCRYCRSGFGLKDLAADHMRPLSRAGGLGLDNLELCCQMDNQAKGSLLPEEFLRLRAFLECEIPEGRMDVLGRLAKANKLAAGAARARMMIQKFGKPKKPAEDIEPF